MTLTPSLQFYLEAVVGPTAELHLAVLVVEGEPGDVDGAGGLEHAGGDVGAQTLARHHHVGRVRRVEGFTRTEADNNMYHHGLFQPRVWCL